MISRRTFLERAAALAASVSFGKTSFGDTVAVSELDPGTLQQWVDPLPLLETVQPVGSRPDPENPSQSLPFYSMAMRELRYKIHRDLPPARVWGFNNSSPGPLFETRSGQGILVEWANKLPARHFLPIDHTLCGAELGEPEVRSVIHLHGGKTPASSDGYPEHWYVPGQSRVYHYPNRQDAALLFYHDHTMGINRLNIYAGLQGLYLIRDNLEDCLNLPKGRYEIPLLLYDRFLLANGQISYPVSPNPKSPWIPEVYCNAILVNGKLAPYLDVEARAYRFRVMNGSNGRFFRLSLNNSAELRIIGSDQGLLAAPVTEKRILLAPAERCDFIVDFSPFAGQNLLLLSDSFEIMQLRIAARTDSVSFLVPQALRPVARMSESDAIRTRRLTLDESMDMVQQSMGMLLNKTPWHAPVTEKPVLNTTEIWEFVNLTEDTHPIHLHLIRFQILDRRQFDVFHYQDKGELRYVSTARPPQPDEAGWKDTVRCESGEVTRIIVKFEGYVGRYVWHCHLLEHEDNEMMRPYEVIAANDEPASVAHS